MAARISGTWVAQPVEVSFWTTQTALISLSVSARKAASMASGSAARRQSSPITSGASPIRVASRSHSQAKCPVSNITTLSPGDSVLTSAASQAPVPEAG